MLYFFFSSRRRHTRCSRDWSSDVCSSDLLLALDLVQGQLQGARGGQPGLQRRELLLGRGEGRGCTGIRCVEGEQRREAGRRRSEEHTSELQSRLHLVCRLLLEKKKNVDEERDST